MNILPALSTSSAQLVDDFLMGCEGILPVVSCKKSVNARVFPLIFFPFFPNNCKRNTY